ncbi:polysaccharide deacetylase [[Clostridium] sordellii]|uniref:Polysaccharide deacetylase n=1 Tax=Paraclostridium sordellii TaxID=1505 RepID=A0ABM9RLB4_PARSO|nr:polysaccharide deacetylase family protein [Paeniclostridium sordellii]CEJ72802.1 putative polysaccharide deacetylase [[Clostridium] sordellii] [Paeniclostridium sordellii]CEN68355.1 polysaccharide deacetylase [[Clostridium] sordellii] [Paeniclostridium sordellii]CEN71622.1 polysaccharide deacetylase [[Clostridium] sordellii] [Paeniclostridium sordellii]CEO21928.1 polysaccharide deacetylase [[Clostridium] sordellii] [Paeniclostridium sordellii]CEP76785.1 polysaccharide deacetylase [[Clostrid
MIMMVLNKKKLKKIFIGILVIILAILGFLFVNRNNDKPTLNMFYKASEPYYNGNKTNSGRVAISCNVDLGWESEYIEKILKVLDEKKAKITFAVTGRWAEENPEFLLEIQKKGHEIANHGYKHLDYGTLDYDKNYEQIKTSKKIIDEIIKTETKFFQAPGGSFNKDTVKAAIDLGYIPYKWDIDTIDWKNRQEPEVIIERVKSKDMKDSSIILMHPTHASAEGIDDIIEIIESKGLKPGKLSDVFDVKKTI